MDVINNLIFGFEHALAMQNLLLCATGCVVGMLVGLLPGLGPLATISLLLPLTFSLPPAGALIMLAGIYYGAQYGDNVSAIIIKPEPIDERSLFRITKDARPGISRLRFRRDRAHFDKPEPKRGPGRNGHAAFVEASREPDRIRKSEAENRFRVRPRREPLELT